MSSSSGKEFSSGAELAPHLQRCQNCGAIVDMSDEQPLKKVRCSVCQAEMTVKRRFPHFVLERIVGEGGMGTVYAARDINLHRPHAVKLMNRSFTEDDKSRMDSLMTEARIMASLNHQNVVKVFSSGFENDQFYITMELVPGGSLDDLMESKGRVAEAQSLRIGIDIAKGLKAAHEQGLVHRDIKPGNILFTEEGMAKIVDFGLARSYDDVSETETEIWGTPYYVPPETLNREKEDFRSDIYSLGATLFHAIAGRPPFEAENASLVAIKHLKNQPVSLKSFAPDVADETAYVINRMLNKDPDQRFNNYDELIDHFEYALQRVTEEGPRRNVLQEQSRKEQTETTRLFGMVTLLLLLLAVGGGLTLFFLRDSIWGERIDPSSPKGKNIIAQQLIQQQKYDEARVYLSQLEQTAGTQEPLNSWINFNSGLLSFLEGDVSKARRTFHPMSTMTPYSSEPEAVKITNFFAQTSRLASAASAVSTEDADLFANNNIEALSLLVFGVKNFHLGKYKEAEHILKRYSEGEVGKPYQWINDYKPLAAELLFDTQTILEVRSLAAGAKSASDARAALDKVNVLRGKAKNKRVVQDIIAQEQALVKKAQG